MLNYLTKLSELISPSGAYMACTMNLCRFFSSGSYSKGCKLTAKEKKREKSETQHALLHLHLVSTCIDLFCRDTCAYKIFFKNNISWQGLRNNNKSVTKIEKYCANFFAFNPITSFLVKMYRFTFYRRERKNRETVEVCLH